MNQSQEPAQLPFRVWLIKKYPADGFNVCINAGAAVGSIFNFWYIVRPSSQVV